MYRLFFYDNEYWDPRECKARAVACTGHSDAMECMCSDQNAISCSVERLNPATGEWDHEGHYLLRPDLPFGQTNNLLH